MGEVKFKFQNEKLEKSHLKVKEKKQKKYFNYTTKLKVQVFSLMYQYYVHFLQHYDQNNAKMSMIDFLKV